MAQQRTSSTLNRRRFAARLGSAAGAATALTAIVPRVAAAQGANVLTGAGATFPQVLYSRWADEYVRIAGVQINYQGIGSGGGIKAISDQTVDFGATDAPMTDQQLAEAKGGPIYHIPTCLGAVVPTYNLPGAPQLRFTGPLLADIFLQKVKTWNDPAIAAENPGVSLPGASIVTVQRSDASGTTFTFTDYLAKISPEFKQRVGASTSVSWPGGLNGRGNPGVAAEVRQNPNTIGYVELAYAVQNALGIGLVKNQAGAYPEPTFGTVSEAAAGALATMPDDLRVSITNAGGERSWPITTFTWILAYRQQRDSAKGQTLANYLFWAITEGQKFAADLFYAPLPQQMLPLVYSKVAGINFQGQSLLNPANVLPPVAREPINTVDNGDGTATTFYSDGTSETYPLGG